MSALFTDRARVARAWYVAAKSSELRCGRVVAMELGPRKLALFRRSDGAVCAVDARCPHLGADLTQGTVTDAGLRCAVHGWTVDGAGRCAPSAVYEAEGARRVRSYPTAERYGLVWVFNGPSVTSPLPEPPGGAWRWSLRLPRQVLRCHPHLMIGNGLDAHHFEVLHDMRLDEAPALTVHSDTHLSLRIRGRSKQPVTNTLLGIGKLPLEGVFSTHEGSIAWASVATPRPFDVLFTGRPTKEGHCVSHTVLFFRSYWPTYVLRALGLMRLLLHKDRQMLEGLEFMRAMAHEDHALRTYAEQIDAMETW